MSLMAFHTSSTEKSRPTKISMVSLSISTNMGMTSLAEQTLKLIFTAI
jgi:hypothetical protein